MINGEAAVLADDNYSKNYILFQELIEKYVIIEPKLFYWFIRNVLSKAILLPITTDTQDTTVTIFSILNDRGLALSVGDIFKAKIYNHLSSEEKADFIEVWHILDVDASNVNESLNPDFHIEWDYH